MASPVRGAVMDLSVTTRRCLLGHILNHRRFIATHAQLAIIRDTMRTSSRINLRGGSYNLDDFSNITPRVVSLVENGSLHLKRQNPVELLKRRIITHFHSSYRNRTGSSPLFAVVEGLSPVVTVKQNFDSLLVPANHVSRSKTDTYYINSKNVLRSHTSAHQVDLIKSGLNHFLVVGDVYRRDDIKRTHYLCFHQMEGVRLFSSTELFQKQQDISLFELGERTDTKQATHTRDTSLVLERHLKMTLERLAKDLYGNDVEHRWVDAYFPFTHPSWELEVKFEGEWMEMLGCGLIEQELLESAGAGRSVGWAFGLGLERLAMPLFDIPDIRLFWSDDPAFSRQFEDVDPNSPVFPPKFVPFPAHRPASYDLSFWVQVPDKVGEIKADFFDLARSIGGDAIENVQLIDEFTHPKTGKTSLCYRILYRDPVKELAREDSLKLHDHLMESIEHELKVEIRRPGQS